MGQELLYLEVNAGLCNRLRALIAGICWAEKLGRNLIVAWPSNKPECKVGFFDLFAKESLPPWVQIMDVMLNAPVTCLSADDFIKIIKSQDSMPSLISHGNFWGGDQDIWLEHLRRFKPNNAVQMYVDFWKEQGLQDIQTALHIRRTDNEKSIRLSPVHLFKELLHDLPDRRVVVFSDEASVVYELKQLFPTKVYAPEQFRSRRDKEGMIEAAAVFFSLASMKQIYGSANSSFSEMASAYGNVPLKSVTFKQFPSNGM